MTIAEVHQLAIDIHAVYRDRTPQAIFGAAVESIQVKDLTVEEAEVLLLLIRAFIEGQQNLDREQAYLDALEELQPQSANAGKIQPTKDGREEHQHITSQLEKP